MKLPYPISSCLLQRVCLTTVIPALRRSGVSGIEGKHGGSCRGRESDLDWLE